MGRLNFRNFIFKRKIKLVQLADIIINDLHITRNDIVLVHISLTNINLIDSTPEDLIFSLKMIVGTTGTLLIPICSERYSNSETTTKARNILKRNNLINELFRQMPETFQSSNQLESFAAWGVMAKNITGSYTKTRDEIDRNSLLNKLGLVKAKIVGIGVPAVDYSYLNELKVFEKYGIPFFWVRAEEAFNSTLS